MNGMLLASVGGAIIVALASYAAYLLWQVKKQQALQRQQQQLAIEKRNANIFDSVNILCMAGIQGSVISLKSVSASIALWITYKVSSASILNKSIPPSASCTMW